MKPYETVCFPSPLAPGLHYSHQVSRLPPERGCLSPMAKSLLSLLCFYCVAAVVLQAIGCFGVCYIWRMLQIAQILDRLPDFKEGIIRLAALDGDRSSVVLLLQCPE